MADNKFKICTALKSDVANKIDICRYFNFLEACTFAEGIVSDRLKAFRQSNLLKAATRANLPPKP
jgi:hypothetical protein